MWILSGKNICKHLSNCLEFPFTPTRKGHLPFSLPKTNQDFLQGRLKSLKIFCLWLFTLHPSRSHTCRKYCRFTACTHERLYTVLLFYTMLPHNLHNVLVSLGLGCYRQCAILQCTRASQHSSFAQVLDTVPATTCSGVPVNRKFFTLKIIRVKNLNFRGFVRSAKFF